MVNYKVIDNFLRDDIFQELKYTLFGNRISWSFKNYLAYPGEIGRRRVGKECQY